MDCVVETTGNVPVYIRGEHGHLPRAERGFFEPALVGMSNDEGVVIAGKREVGENLKCYSGITPHIDVTHALPMLLPSLEQALLGQGLSVTGYIRQAAGAKLVTLGEHTVANLYVRVFFAVLCLFVSGSDRLSRPRIRLQMATFQRSRAWSCNSHQVQITQRQPSVTQASTPWILLASGYHGLLRNNGRDCGMAEVL